MSHLKLKKRRLKSDPAVILAGFGTTSRSAYIYDEIGNRMEKLLPDVRITWAYTSEIVREKKAFPGLLDAIAGLESEGYRKIIVQPLHIFPGTEYRVLESTCQGFSNLRIIMGETLGHRWPYIEAVFEAISTDFLTEAGSVNIIAAHGSPLAAEPANAIFQGLSAYCNEIWDNVHFTTIDGMPSFQMLLKKLKRTIPESSVRRARIFPLMLTAGKHVDDDLLEGDDSLSAELTALGLKVDFPTVEVAEKAIPKALGAYPEIITMFHERVQRALSLFQYY